VREIVVRPHALDSYDDLDEVKDDPEPQR